MSNSHVVPAESSPETGGEAVALELSQGGLLLPGDQIFKPTLPTDFDFGAYAERNVEIAKHLPEGGKTSY